MIHQSAILTFPKALVGEPIISRLARDHRVDVNILQARILPEEDGHLFAILAGSRRAIDGAFKYLDGLGVRSIRTARNIVWDDRRCVHCGACVGQCKPGAFSVDAATSETVFEAERCIACELCIPACGYGALESVGEQLRRTGTL